MNYIEKKSLYESIMKDVKRIVKKHLNEIASNDYDDEHRLFEMARIDDPHFDKLPKNIKIYVYGENDNQGTKTPHFHVIGENFEFEVHIQHIHNLDIWRTKRIDKQDNAGTWKERADIRKAILKWLDKPNTELTPLTNAASIVAQWNMNNTENRIPQTYKD